ncbi:MAG: signal peptidase I [Lachnospiraceae bacterium]|nr:signal peptidase I [Lachnospiraceae bacterium]
MSKRKGLSFYKKKKKLSASVIREIWSYVFLVFATVLIAFVLVYSIGMKTNVIGVSMEPRLYNGQAILVNRLGYKIFPPKAGDVVVFLPNGNKNSHFYVKRVIAVPGNRVQIKEGKLYVNGTLYEGVDYDKIADPGIAENEIVLESDEFFVLGDNVNNSEDSRSGNIGAVKRQDIIGKVWFHMAAGDTSVGFMK